MRTTVLGLISWIRHIPRTQQRTRRDVFRRNLRPHHYTPVHAAEKPRRLGAYATAYTVALLRGSVEGLQAPFDVSRDAWSSQGVSGGQEADSFSHLRRRPTPTAPQGHTPVCHRQRR